MFDFKVEEILEGETKILIVNVTFDKKINFNIYLKKNAESELCAYIDKSVNAEIIKQLNLVNPSFGFMAGMFLQMYQPIEINYDCVTGEFNEIFVNSTPYDIKQFNTNFIELIFH